MFACGQQRQNKYANAQFDIEQGNVRIITFGFDLESLINNSFRQIDSLQKHYGFRNDNQRCIEDRISIIDVNKYNHIVFDFLNKRNWYKNFERQFDSLKVFIK